MLRKILATALLAIIASGCSEKTPDSASAGAPAAHNMTASQLTMAAGTASQELNHNMIHWLEPTGPALHIRSEEEKQHGMEFGREEPAPEFLQPPLDSLLPDFQPGLAAGTSGSILGGASDVLPGLVKLWIKEFNKVYPNIKIDIATPYAGSLGMLEVIDGDYDFVFVSRELKPTDITSFNQKYGYDPLSVPVSGASYRHYGFLDAIGFFVNINNPLSKLSFDQIDALFSSTRHRGGKEIKTWGDLGLSGEWADQPVHLYGIEPWNGFEEFVRQRALNYAGKRGEWREDVHFEHHSFTISELVAKDPLGIGYTGLAYITSPVKMLPLAGDKGSENYIAPSYEQVANASYPLSRLIYLATNKEPGKKLDPIIDEFLRFILSKQGQQLVLDHAIYLPLRNWQLANSLQILD